MAPPAEELSLAEQLDVFEEPLRRWLELLQARRAEARRFFETSDQREQSAAPDGDAEMAELESRRGSELGHLLQACLRLDEAEPALLAEMTAFVQTVVAAASLGDRGAADQATLDQVLEVLLGLAGRHRSISRLLASAERSTADFFTLGRLPHDLRLRVAAAQERRAAESLVVQAWEHSIDAIPGRAPLSDAALRDRQPRIPELDVLTTGLTRWVRSLADWSRASATFSKLMVSVSVDALRPDGNQDRAVYAARLDAALPPVADGLLATATAGAQALGALDGALRAALLRASAGDLSRWDTAELVGLLPVLLTLGADWSASDVTWPEDQLAASDPDALGRAGSLHVVRAALAAFEEQVSVMGTWVPLVETSGLLRG